LRWRAVFASFEQRTAAAHRRGDSAALLVARHRHADGLSCMIIANRNKGGKARVAPSFTASRSTRRPRRHIARSRRGDHITASPTALVTVDDAGRVAARRRRLMFMLDLAVPRDIGLRSRLEDVYPSR
jgi:glutamyl-tRNA reductase